MWFGVFFRICMQYMVRKTSDAIAAISIPNRLHQVRTLTMLTSLLVKIYTYFYFYFSTTILLG